MSAWHLGQLLLFEAVMLAGLFVYWRYGFYGSWLSLALRLLACLFAAILLVAGFDLWWQQMPLIRY